MGRVLQNYTFDKIRGTVHLKSQCILFILCKLYINNTYLKRKTQKTRKEEIETLFVHNAITYTENLYKFRDELFTNSAICKANYISIKQIENEIF